MVPFGTIFYFAEEEGFEPPVPCSTTVFKTVAFNHSAIPPIHHTQREISSRNHTD